MLKWNSSTGRYLFNASAEQRSNRLDIAVAINHFCNGNPHRPQDGLTNWSYYELAQLIAEQTNEVEFFNRAVSWFAHSN